MAKIMDPIVPILSILGYWAIILGPSGGPGTCLFQRSCCSSHGCSDGGGNQQQAGSPDGERLHGQNHMDDSCSLFGRPLCLKGLLIVPLRVS